MAYQGAGRLGAPHCGVRTVCWCRDSGDWRATPSEQDCNAWFPHKGTPPSLLHRGLARPDGPARKKLGGEKSERRETRRRALWHERRHRALCPALRVPARAGPAAPPRRRSAREAGPWLAGRRGAGARALGGRGAPSCAREGSGRRARPLFLVRIPPSAASALAPYLERRHP